MVFSEEDTRRYDFQLLQNGAVNLYWRMELFRAAIDELRALDYKILDLRFDNEQQFQQDLSDALKWEESFGYGPWSGNLDGLDDGLREEPFNSSDDSVLAISNYDALAESDERLSRELLDMIECHSRDYLLFGKRLIGLIQTNDPKFECVGIGGTRAWWRDSAGGLESKKRSRRVDVWYSLQSDYCYFLINRLLKLSGEGVYVRVRPVLGLVLRMPEATAHRSQREQDYFITDTKRTADFLGLPHVYPDPSPIQFEPGSLWIASKEQPRVERLCRLFVGANRADKGLDFLDRVVRALWDGSQPGWDKSDFLFEAMEDLGLDHDAVLRENDWPGVQAELSKNHQAMLDTGHWGVPLMVFEGEPFYGQDRFDQLLWRIGIELDA